VLDGHVPPNCVNPQVYASKAGVVS
jgi:hypothetical protein